MTKAPSARRCSAGRSQAKRLRCCPPRLLRWCCASSGRAAASRRTAEPVLLAAGGLFLAGGAAVEVTPVTGCHVLAAGFSGDSGLHRPQPRACPPRLPATAAPAPWPPQLLGELAAAMERGGAAGLSALCYHILCELAAADAAVPGFRRWWRMRCWPSARIMQACTAWRS